MSAAPPYDGPQFRALVVEMGFVTEAQLEVALALQEELRDGGVWAHLGDLLEELGELTHDQHQQVLLQIDMHRALAALPDDGRGPRGAAWAVSAATPLCLVGTVSGVLACAAAMLLGAAIALGRPTRWVALGWLAAAAVPGTPLGVTAGAGTAFRRFRTAAIAAGLAAASAALTLLPVGWTPLHALLIAAVVLAATRRRP